MEFILKYVGFDWPRMADQVTSTDPNRRCRRCGNAVSSSFVRVFAIGETVHGCLECLPRSQLSDGAAAKRMDDDEERQVAWR